jgi:hypothetical protein
MTSFSRGDIVLVKFVSADEKTRNNDPPSSWVPTVTTKAEEKPSWPPSPATSVECW